MQLLLDFWLRWDFPILFPPQNSQKLKNERLQIPFPPQALWLPPGRLTWNLQITHLERKMIFQTSMIMFHVNLPGCKRFFWGGPSSFQSRDESDGVTVGLFLSKVQTHLFGRKNNWTFLGERVDGMVFAPSTWRDVRDVFFFFKHVF